ncbi:MAG: TFIIB-type zinc ribbon-containing protein [Pseudomonadota bacterium]
MGKKIATCNYCGTRSVLVFDEARHELTCGACGAPLHDMKFMPQPVENKTKKPVSPKRSTPSGAATGWAFKDRKTKKKKKRKPMFHRVLEEIIDEIEDIFD